jgi:GMP synthase (glutamine-hydrolysing)
LIARKVRDLGVYSEVRPSDTIASELAGRRGIIISGGPASVYEPGSPQIDPAIFDSKVAILGICYGQQLMAHWLGGSVRKGTKGEYGSAVLNLDGPADLFKGWNMREQVWMSHRDTVAEAPAGFTVLAATPTCSIAAIGNEARKLYGVQFHPEVVHTTKGTDLLRNFLFDICGCEKDWDPRDRVPSIEAEIRETVAGRSVFFFVSGGVDSTVAFTLCLRALGPERVHGVYVDTGLMRAGETEFVRRMFDQLGAGTVEIDQAEAQFLGALSLVVEPEAKRHVIGEQFVKVQERIIESRHLLDGNWILGQGTIYPDTIESGGSAKSAVIKTHHNRVAGIQKLLDEKRIVEPLSSFYKDEVREIGRELGLPAEFLERHPFPGPGLAIRCLCAGEDAKLRVADGGYVVPILSVGVQGDSRSYAPVLAIDQFPGADGKLQNEASEIVNATAEINRVIARVASTVGLPEMRVFEAGLSKERIERLRASDAVVREMSAASGFDAKVWQFPVVLIPLGCDGRPDSVVLRPIDSIDGMTAQSVGMEELLLRSMAERLLGVEGVCGVFYDLTHKPPATIEWE